jgi:uncharacterized protein (TIGR00288 family)
MNPTSAAAPRGPRTVALLMDFENLVIGLENSDPANEKPFSIAEVIGHLQKNYGPVIYRKAFADWSNAKFRKYVMDLTRAGVEMQHVVRTGINSKNAADVYLVIQAMDCLLHYPNIDTYAIVTGDGDFLPLITKLKATGRHVIGMGSQGTISNVLQENCDEYICYSQRGLTTRAEAPSDFAAVTAALREGLGLDELLPARRAFGVLRERIPGFHPRAYGFGNIFDLLRAVPGLILSPREEGEETIRWADGNAPWPPPRRMPEPAPVAGEAAPPPAGEPAAAAISVPAAPAQPVPAALDPAFADYMTSTRWFVRDPALREPVIQGIFDMLANRTGSITLDNLRLRVPQADKITDKEWFGTLFSLIHGGCLWEDTMTSDRPLADRAVSLFRGVDQPEEFLLRYYCSLFHKAFNERDDVSPGMCSLLMYGDAEDAHLGLFEKVLARLRERS